MAKANLSTLFDLRWLKEPAPEVQYDRVIVWLALSLMLVGLIMVSSASIPVSITQKGEAFFYAVRHAIYLVMALGAAVFVMQISIARWERWSLLAAGISILLLLIVLIIGNEVNGSTRWISFAGINVQPAEITKLALLMCISSYLARRNKAVRESFREFIKPIGLISVVALLLLGQPDLGSVVVVFVTTIGLLFLAGARLIQFLPILLLSLSSVGILIAVAPYRVRRVTSFLDPWQDPFGSGYQLTQSLMAFGRGGWQGQGLGNSIQKLEYLPEAHTDFVIAVLAEELGLMGVCLVLALVFSLAFRALIIGKRCLEDHQFFGGYLATGIGILIAFQALVNIGAAAGMIPTKGLTLPLVSYGGSSLIIMSITVAILLRIDYEYRLSRTPAHQRIKRNDRRKKH